MCLLLLVFLTHFHKLSRNACFEAFNLQMLFTLAWVKVVQACTGDGEVGTGDTVDNTTLYSAPGNVEIQ